MKIFQITINGIATKFNFSDKIKLVDKMEELQKHGKVSFLIINLN